MAPTASTAPTAEAERARRGGIVCFNRTDSVVLFELCVRDRYGEHCILIPREDIESLSAVFRTMFPESAENVSE